MDNRTIAAALVLLAMIVAFSVFLALWEGSGLDRPRMAGWKRVLRWVRKRGR